MYKRQQIAAAFGGLNRIDFASDSFSVRPIVVSPERKRELEGNLMMFFTGFTRFSSDMQKKNCVADKIVQLKEMLDLVDVAEGVLTDKSKDLAEFGRLLDTTWRIKRGTGGQVSTGTIDALYERGIKAGALGGKLLGAGGGGFLVFYVEPDARDSVRKAMGDLLHIPFEFEDGGTSVVYYDPEDYELPEER